MERNLWNVVHAGRHLPRVHRKQRAQPRVGSRVGNDAGLEADQLALARRPQSHVLNLPASVCHRDHVLGAKLEPAHGSLEPQHQRAEHALLWVGHQLGAEPATDIAGDRADFRLGQADRLRYLVAHAKCHLRGNPHANPALAIRLREHRVGLDRHGGKALVDKPRAHHDFGALQRAALADLSRERDVVALVGMKHRRALSQRSGGIDDHRQRLVVDHHRRGGVDSVRPRIRHRDSHDVADKPHHLFSKRWACHRVRGRKRRPRFESEVRGDKHTHHARQ